MFGEIFIQKLIIILVTNMFGGKYIINTENKWNKEDFHSWNRLKEIGKIIVKKNKLKKKSLYKTKGI